MTARSAGVHPGRKRQHRRILRADHRRSRKMVHSVVYRSPAVFRCSQASVAASTMPASLRARAAGATALMVHQPPIRSFCRAALLPTCSGSVAEMARRLLYLRNDGIGLDAIEQLCKVPGVAGVKWLRRRRCGSPKDLPRRSQHCSPAVYGDMARRLCRRARGFTSGLITVWPSTVAIHAASRRRLPARQPVDRRDASFEEIRAEEQNGTNATAVKAAATMATIGLTRPPSAWPLTEKDDRAQASVDVVVLDLAPTKSKAPVAALRRGRSKIDQLRSTRFGTSQKLDWSCTCGARSYGVQPASWAPGRPQSHPRTNRLRAAAGTSATPARALTSASAVCTSLTCCT